MRCVECPDRTTAEPQVKPVDAGIAGGSATREYERRMAKREAAVRAKWGDRIGGLIVKWGEPPQSTRSWRIGARGEEKLAAALATIDGLRILNDRKVPKTRANIDHIAITRAGVFVIDAKNIRGRIHVRNEGWLWRPNWRLFVGRRDVSKLAGGLDWQVEAVNHAFVAAGLDPLPEVTPVLCFIDGDWPFISAPHDYMGVRLESERSIQRLLTSADRLTPAEVDGLTALLAAALQPKSLMSDPK